MRVDMMNVSQKKMSLFIDLGSKREYLFAEH